MAKISKKIEIDLTPDDLACAFENFDNKEQAEFFNLLGKKVKEWHNAWCFQATSIVDNLDSDGLSLIEEICQYLNS